MLRLTFPVAAALDDDLVAGVGQPVESAVAQDGVLEETEPLVHGPVAGYDEAGHPVPVRDQLVQVRGLLRVEAMEPQVVQDEQVWRQEGPDGAVHQTGQNQEPSYERRNSNGRLHYSWAVNLDASM